MSASPYIGEIRIFGFNYAPVGWALCNGQILSISQYSALFALIGTYYGGDGTSTFQLPDLQGRVPLHQGNGLGLSAYNVGEVTGTENVTLLNNNMPQHTHVVNVTTNTGSNVSDPTGAYLAVPTAGPRGTTVSPYSKAASNANLAPNAIGVAGGNVPFSVIQPVLCVSFCIALTGIFPTRS